MTTWWLNHPSEKILLFVKLDGFPKDRDEKSSKTLKPPPLVIYLLSFNMRVL